LVFCASLYAMVLFPGASDVTVCMYPLCSLANMIVAVVSWRMFERHCAVAAAWRALPNAGRSTLISSAIMPMTTSSSTSVNARATTDERLVTVRLTPLGMKVMCAPR
jgi:hypothetical protein